MTRSIPSRYQDPADLIWLHAASQLGITVKRGADVYASWDGQGTLTLASPEYLDPDDCLAQLIFHELCHLLVSGEGARRLSDWGLDNTSPKDLVYEYATNRLQAALAGAYGLRQFMTVTTIWRTYYDALPLDPLATGTDAAIPLAAAGMARARQEPYRTVLHQVLAATAALAASLRGLTPDDSIWQLVTARHPTGMRMHQDDRMLCRHCAWVMVQRDDKLTCRYQRPGCRPVDYRLLQPGTTEGTVRLAAAQQACERFEPPLAAQDCQVCGACCRQGFDVVEVKPKERFATRHADLIEHRTEQRYVVPRPEGRCVALDGTGNPDAPYRCRHYEDRPHSCRQFEMGGDACLIARQRVGMVKKKSAVKGQKGQDSHSDLGSC